MKKIIIYARVAYQDKTGKQGILNVQVEMLTKYCVKNNFLILKVFKETAKGNHFSRPAYRKMLRAIKNKQLKADCILFTNWDRFGTDFYTTAKAVAEIEKQGVVLVAMEKTPKSRAIYKILKRFLKKSN